MTFKPGAQALNVESVGAGHWAGADKVGEIVHGHAGGLWGRFLVVGINNAHQGFPVANDQATGFDAYGVLPLHGLELLIDALP